MQTALGHFDAAEEYLLAVPRRSVRLRLACLWPLLLGLATLARVARGGTWLDPDTTVKVSRGWVYRMMAPFAARRMLQLAAPALDKKPSPPSGRRNLTIFFRMKSAPKTCEAIRPASRCEATIPASRRWCNISASFDEVGIHARGSFRWSLDYSWSIPHARASLRHKSSKSPCS